MEAAHRPPRQLSFVEHKTLWNGAAVALVEPCDELQLAARLVGHQLLTLDALTGGQNAAAAASATVVS